MKTKWFIFFLTITITFFTLIPFGNAEELNLSISSNNAILLEANTGTILYQLNSEEKKYPASITKIATAIYAIEHANLEDVVTVSSNARNAEGTRVYLESGEKVTLEKLLYGLMINSGNDAATAIAEHISESEQQFAFDMTEYFKRNLHLQNTNFTNASGLFDENHYTTAYDMAKIVKYALNNEQFMKFFNAKELRWIGESWDTTIQSHHRIVNGEIPYEGITGGKNGYVPESRYTLATTAERGEMHLIAIVLDGRKNDVYNDTFKLFDYGFNMFELQSIPSYTSFTEQDHVYQNLHSINFYTLIDSTYRTEVKNATLKIYNSNNELINKASLFENKPQTLFQAVEKSSIEPKLLNKEEPVRTMIAGLVIVVLISILFFSRIK